MTVASPPTDHLALAFVGLVFSLYGFTLILLRFAARCRLTTVMLSALGLCAWLGFCAWLATSGALVADVEAVPPTLVRYVLLPAVVLVLALTFLPRTGELLDRVPADWLVSFQAFRIPMELILAGLADAEVIHPRMTYHGLNFDIVTGVLALLLGYLMHKQRAPRWSVVVFNWVGLGLLVVVVGVALLSLPTPLQHFHDEPQLRVVFHVPFVWLPGFVVPLALLGHALSLRKAARP